eukprot:gb/GECH01000460.1/.p1 GENE.gb/GECH01000460.1/~~gb/GECH01000460.1/.p1  ORF type:complete len:406 (+),score=75.17 gb/GECH01000460.1/:1-1218(+)
MESELSKQEEILLNNDVVNLKVNNEDLDFLTTKIKKNSRMNSLKISRKHRIVAFTPDICDQLFQAIQNNPSISILNFRDCNLGEDGIIILSQNLINNNETIEELILDENEMTNTALECLAQSLMNNKHIKRISLAGNIFTDQGWIILGEALKYNKSLLEINLSGKKLLSGFPNFIEALKHNNTINCFHLPNPSRRLSVFDQGVQLINELLEQHESIGTIYAREWDYEYWNSLSSDEELSTFIESLKFQDRSLYYYVKNIPKEEWKILLEKARIREDRNLFRDNNNIYAPPDCYRRDGYRRHRYRRQRFRRFSNISDSSSDEDEDYIYNTSDVSFVLQKISDAWMKENGYSPSAIDKIIKYRELPKNPFLSNEAKNNMTKNQHFYNHFGFFNQVKDLWDCSLGSFY